MIAVTAIAYPSISFAESKLFGEGEQLCLSGFQNLSEARVQVFSDLHLRLPFLHAIELDKGNRPQSHDKDKFHLLKYLRKLNQEARQGALESDRSEVLVFNGDSFEITGSAAIYGEGHVPYKVNGELVNEKLTNKVLDEILKSNQDLIKELAEFLGYSDNHKIVFIRGNHDNFIWRSKQAQSQIRTALGLGADSKKLIFTSELKIPEMKFYARHGQDLDRFNQSDSEGLNAGDLITYLAHKFTKQTMSAIQKLKVGVSANAKELLDEFSQQVENVANVRPLTTFWLYMGELVKKYSQRCLEGESLTALADKIELIKADFANNLLSLISDCNKHIAELCSRGFFSSLMHRWIEKVPKWLSKKLASSPKAQTFAINLVDKCKEYFSDSNKAQHEESGRIAATNADIDLVCFGHTHKQADKRGFVRDGEGPFKESRYVNSDSWAPVVYAKVADRKKVKFLREEFPSGILTMEYKPDLKKAKAELIRTSSFYNSEIDKLDLKTE